jgi:tRNA pseudouridine55 synthase
VSKPSATDFTEGRVLLIDKPLHWTSFDVVNKMRYAIRKTYNFKKFKVGHAGTLDPLATGLLIVCAGKATKQINNYMGLPKEYLGTITLGATTPSYDLETEVNQIFQTDHITDELLEKVRLSFLGDIEQVPPIFSAIKKDGKKAYEAARNGEEIKLNARTVHIDTFEIERINSDTIQFKVVCSKGTYIRSLAHDFGKALNSGAHLSSLRRSAIGEYSVTEAISPQEFVTQLED